MNTAKISLSFFVVYHFVCAEQHCCNFSGMFRIKIKASFLVWSNFKIGWKQKKNGNFCNTMGRMRKIEMETF